MNRLLFGCIILFFFIPFRSRVESKEPTHPIQIKKSEIKATSGHVVITLLVMLFAVGCAQFVWVKPGGTQDQFDKDRYACYQEAMRPYLNPWVDPSYPGIRIIKNTAADFSIDDKSFKLCLEARGWHPVMQ